MDEHRTFANIARRVQGVEADGQDVQQFMSDSPWPARAVIRPRPSGIGCYPGVATGRRAPCG
jgi:hypothetical protein